MDDSASHRAAARHHQDSRLQPNQPPLDRFGQPDEKRPPARPIAARKHPANQAVGPKPNDGGRTPPGEYAGKKKTFFLRKTDGRGPPTSPWLGPSPNSATIFFPSVKFRCRVDRGGFPGPHTPPPSFAIHIRAAVPRQDHGADLYLLRWRIIKPAGQRPFRRRTRAGSGIKREKISGFGANRTFQTPRPGPVPVFRRR